MLPVATSDTAMTGRVVIMEMTVVIAAAISEMIIADSATMDVAIAAFVVTVVVAVEVAVEVDAKTALDKGEAAVEVIPVEVVEAVVVVIPVEVVEAVVDVAEVVAVVETKSTKRQLQDAIQQKPKITIVTRDEQNYAKMYGHLMVL
jgi:hypothetical protein